MNAMDWCLPHYQSSCAELRAFQRVGSDRVNKLL